MHNVSSSSFSTTKRSLFLFMVFALIVPFIFAGCRKEQEKTPVSIQASTCEILDALPKDIDKPVEVTYTNKAKFFGLTVSRQPQNQLKVSYYWQIMDELGPHNRAFVIFSDADGKQLFGNDHDLCQRKPFSELKGRFIKETQTAFFPETAIGKKVHVGIGIFAPEMTADTRLKITSSGNVKTEDANTRAIVADMTL